MRRDSRPAEPRDLDFEIDFQSAPDKFFRGDVREGAGRHLIFAIDEQIATLRRPHTWYGDGAFKIAGKPFKQLYALHAFVRGARGSVKQVPLVFVLMSHRRQEDYVAVLDAVREIAPGAQPTAVVMDFEMAFWLAVSEVFPSAERHGCFFHWCQCVFRKIQKLGLTTAYESNPDMRHFMRAVMSLPLLPADKAPEAFDLLNAINPYEQLKPLLAYVRRAWFFNAMFTPESWSVFGRAVRTMNDAEGRRRRLRGLFSWRARAPFYRMCGIIHKESKMVALQTKLVMAGQRIRVHSKATRSYQKRLGTIWR